MGAAMSIASQNGTLQTETIVSPEAQNGVGNHNIWRIGEPEISDLLSDPITLLLMRRDGVSGGSLNILLESTREKLLKSASNGDGSSKE
jgi:hypothetical protein